MSGGAVKFQCSWAQNFPEAPTPVCTSSTIIKTPLSWVMSARPWKKKAVACASPPSDCTGSTMMAATFPLYSLMICSNSAKHLCSSFAFSASNSARGYLNWGKGATGQSKAGMSNLWMALDRVVESEPNKRPWNPFSNDKITMSEAPGPWFFITDCNSSSEKPSAPLFLVCWYMKAALYAVSLASEPLNAVHTLVIPGGAAARIPCFKIFA